MTYTVVTIRVPTTEAATGNELLALARSALDNIAYNIGPEPLRQTWGLGHPYLPRAGAVDWTLSLGVRGADRSRPVIGQPGVRA